MYAPATDDEFAREVRAGLTRAGQKTLPCRYLYDDVGSALFEAITYLPEYGLTRADQRILESCAGELAASLPGNVAVAELGSATGAKTRPILEALRARQPVVYYPIDLSATPLERCARELGDVATVRPLPVNYLEGMRQVAERRARGQKLLVLFLGSTIGNFEPCAAIDFLHTIRQCLQPGDALLLGTDLVKPKALLLAAYDDPAGVTAAFNRNLLARVNRELDADFDLRQFAHQARYHKARQRIEMHLRAKSAQVVNIRGAGLVVEFAANETICTEACHKFQPEQIRGMARAAGFRMEAQWTDEEWAFAESLLVAI